MNHTFKPKKSKNPIIPADKDCPVFWPGYERDMETLYAIGFALNSFETFLVARDETYGDKHGTSHSMNSYFPAFITRITIPPRKPWYMGHANKFYLACQRLSANRRNK